MTIGPIKSGLSHKMIDAARKQAKQKDAASKAAKIMKKSKKTNLDKLSPEQQERIQKELERRGWAKSKK